MSAPSKRRGPDGTQGETIALWIGIGAVVALVVVVNVGLHLGRMLAGMPRVENANPFTVVFDVVLGKTEWPLWSTIVAIAVALVLAGIILLGWLMFRPSGKREDVDAAAQYMGRGRQIKALTQAAVAAKAARLGVQAKQVGVKLGETVAGAISVFTSWEDVALTIAGPRTGKTTSQVIPAIAEAPGAVVTTSNKRDVVDATRTLRQKAGEVWVFDPQGVANEPATWWWNPLSYVTNEVKAGQLAKLFSDAARPAGSRRDAFFDGSAETLLAGMLLAAARTGRPLSQVYLWLTDVDNDEAVILLRELGEQLSAASVGQIISAPEKQKGGIYGTAQQIMSFMLNSAAVQWVEATPGDTRKQFSPAEFVRSTGTLYSLSKEGVGSTGPLVTALTVAITEAAEDYAKTQPGGRLALPLILVLDEAANVCRWNNLPDLYSHYGSRGIWILTILQSWSQGVEVWGQDGMRKLWTAANAKLYLGGVDEPQFLEDLSRLVGDYERNSRSVSYGPGGTSNQHQARSERVLDASDLRALPRGRAVLLYSGVPPVLLRTVPWMDGPHAEEISAAIARSEKVAA